jgi:serine/threonine protein phosphatase PrpC
MDADGRLEIAAGFATALGPRKDNQDFGAVHLGTPSEQALHGMLAIVADGVSGSRAGRVRRNWRAVPLSTAIWTRAR